ncbi:MAG: hypothetical protein PUC11_04250 [Elusimicrobia bacterium]|nr:hypothetical protein [Elusimicrobiota bacterium]
MGLVINGKTYKIVCLNGKEYSRGYFNGRLVLNVPDNNAYLWAGPGVRLAADDTSAVSYLNTPQIISNTLSGAAIGLQTFSLSFYVHKDAVETGTVRLLELPGVVSVKSEASALAFKFAWEKNPVWRFCKTTDFASGWNKVTLAKTGKKLAVGVNTHEYILADHTTSTPVKNKIYRGFYTDRYLTAKEIRTTPFTVIFNIMPKDVNYANQTIFSDTSNQNTKLYMDTSARLVYQESLSSGTYTYGRSSFSTPFVLAEEKRYFVKLRSGVGLDIAEDDNTTSLDDVINGTDSLEWVRPVYKNDNGNLASWDRFPYCWGAFLYSNSSSYVWRGGIDVAKMAVIKEGEVIFDGRRDALDVHEDSSTSWSVEEWQDKPDLPDLPAPGPLSVTPGWMKVKDVKANLI